jgi:predicted  nucleic acid-binding Zn-ribbon protein
MATEKTPDHKRISRAENSAQQWKMKAIERRETVEALNEQLETASENAKIKNTELNEAKKHSINLEKQVKDLTEQLRLANQAITSLQTDMHEFKKKAYR